MLCAHWTVAGETEFHWGFLAAGGELGAEPELPASLRARAEAMREEAPLVCLRALVAAAAACSRERACANSCC